MANKKYELLPKTRIKHPLEKGKVLWVRRVRALIDIPFHGVRRGELGGWIVMSENRFFGHENDDYEAYLSHLGAAWIGGNALVYRATIMDNAIVEDDAVVFGTISNTMGPMLNIGGGSVVRHEAVIIQTYVPHDVASITQGDISGSTVIRNPSSVSRQFRLYGNAILNGTQSLEPTTSSINEALNPAYDSTATQRLRINPAINPKLALPPEQYEQYKNFLLLKKGNYAKEVENYALMEEIHKVTLEKHKALEEAREREIVSHSKTSTHEILLEEIREKVDSYQNDIVKILAYPVMVDLTDEHTLALMESLSKTSRIDPATAPNDFIVAVDNLESKFMVAESNALRIAKTHLSDAHIKKVETAGQLLAVAGNESSTINERSVALKQGFKHLEGIIGVSPVAVERFKVKTGLLEIEA